MAIKLYLQAVSKSYISCTFRVDARCCILYSPQVRFCCHFPVGSTDTCWVSLFKLNGKCSSTEDSFHSTGIVVREAQPYKINSPDTKKLLLRKIGHSDLLYVIDMDLKVVENGSALTYFDYFTYKIPAGVQFLSKKCCLNCYHQQRRRKIALLTSNVDVVDLQTNEQSEKPFFIKYIAFNTQVTSLYSRQVRRF